MKKLLLLIALMLTALTVSAYDFEVDGICYNIISSTDNTCEVTHKNVIVEPNFYEPYDGDVFIPSTVAYGGKVYTVTSIGAEAFWGSNYMTNVIIPNTVVHIGDRAFESCCSLTEITIPKEVEYIGKEAFRYCMELKSVVVPNSVVTIDEWAFGSCKSLTNVTITNGVVNIGQYAFCGCDSLASVVIPSSVTSIGMYAFVSCNCMKSIKVDESNQYYDSRENCNAIIETSTSTLVTGCQSTIIPSSVKIIGTGAFAECHGLTEVSIPDGVTSIGGSAFENCIYLTCVAIPNGVTSIEQYVFCGCIALASVTMPNSAVRIRSCAFLDCTSLTNVTIPKSVTNIEQNAFSGCSNLVSVTMLGSTPCSMGFSYYYGGVDYFVGAFDECASLETIYVPFGNSNSYKSAEGWSIYSDIIVEKGTSLVDGISYTNYKETKDDINYTRTFNNTSWQPWYVPFDMTLTSDLMEDFAFAKIEGVVIEDQNTADESDDATFISIVRLAEGSVIKGNVPYFVQAKTTGEKTISVENTTVKAAESFSFSVNSASNVFTFTGIYEPRTSTVEDCNAWYYFSGGQFCQPGKAGITLKAMRFYMTIDERTDNPYATASAGGSKVIGIREVGDGATGFDTMPAYNGVPADDAVYDLMGRRVSNPQHGLYVVNGQKRFIP